MAICGMCKKDEGNPDCVFCKDQKVSQPEVPSPPSLDIKPKQQGQILLKKGNSKVLIKKTPSIVAKVSWRSGTDYDIFALVMTKAGHIHHVATFGATGIPPMMNYGNGAVSHRGDVVGGSSGGFLGGIFSKTPDESVEIIDIRPNDDILAVVPVAYSAQSNGTGSFYHYKVSLAIDNQQGDTVTISAENANNNDTVYTCVPGIIYNRPDGIEIEALELYSAPGSELRPSLSLQQNGSIQVQMDFGPSNDYK